LARDNIINEDPLILHNVASNALQKAHIDQVLAYWSPTKLCPKRLVTIGLTTQIAQKHRELQTHRSIYMLVEAKDVFPF
jgi:hypothetical protein